MDLGELRWVTLGATVVWACLMIALERRFPYDRQRFLRKGVWTDFAWYTIVQSLLLGWVISVFIAWVDASSAWSRLRLVGDWPFWAQFLLFFVTHDLYIYWFHRWQHANRYLWRTHEAHHSVEDVDWVAGSRSHVLEIMINQTIEYAPIVLLGAAPEIALLKGLVDAMWGMWIHSNINVKTGALQYVLNGPEMHRWHHANHLPWPGRNFATKIAVWDWLFGTAYRPDAKPEGYGLDPEEQARFPCDFSHAVDASGWSWLLQNAYAFRRFPSRSRSASNAPVAANPEVR